MIVRYTIMENTVVKNLPKCHIFNFPTKKITLCKIFFALFKSFQIFVTVLFYLVIYDIRTVLKIKKDF